MDQNPIDENDVGDDQNPAVGRVNPEGLVSRSSNFFGRLVSPNVNFVSGIGKLLFSGNNLDAVRLKQDVGGDINGGDDPLEDNVDGNMNGNPPAGNVLPPVGFNLDAVDGVPVEDNADGVPQNVGDNGGTPQQNSGSSGGRARGRNNCASAGGVICDQEDHCSGGLRTLGQITVDSGEICCSVGCGSEELDPVSGEIKVQVETKCENGIKNIYSCDNYETPLASCQKLLPQPCESISNMKQKLPFFGLISVIVLISLLFVYYLRKNKFSNV